MSKHRRSKYLSPRIKIGEQFSAHPIDAIMGASS